MPVSDQVSVVIPTYDRMQPLKRAIRSVLAQSHAASEVIIVDDGSRDATAEMIRREFPHCRYLHQENGGVSRARNSGIRAARYDWIALLDSDDEWLPGKLAAQLHCLRKQQDCRVCHTEEIWVRNGRRVNPMKKHAKSGGWIFRRCLPLCVISPSSVLIHRALFDQCGLFDESLPACEDYDLWLRLCARHPVGFVEQPQIVKYGGHEDQLSRRYWGMDRFRLQALENIISSGSISGEDLTAAIATLTEKAGILAQGAEKRGRLDDARRYRAIQHKFR